MTSFPNKMVHNAYVSLDGKVIKRNMNRQRFIDQNDCSDYDYHAVVWLIDNGWVVQLPYNPLNFVLQWQRKDQSEKLCHM